MELLDPRDHLLVCALALSKYLLVALADTFLFDHVTSIHDTNTHSHSSSHEVLFVQNAQRAACDGVTGNEGAWKPYCPYNMNATCIETCGGVCFSSFVLQRASVDDVSFSCSVLQLFLVLHITFGCTAGKREYKAIFFWLDLVTVLLCRTGFGLYAEMLICQWGTVMIEDFAIWGYFDILQI